MDHRRGCCWQILQIWGYCRKGHPICDHKPPVFVWISSTPLIQSRMESHLLQCWKRVIHRMKLICCLAGQSSHIYRKQKAMVNVAGTSSGCFRVEKWSSQGCVLSPYLVDILVETVVQETLDRLKCDLQIYSWQTTTNSTIRWYCFTAKTENKLQEIVNKLDEASRKFSLLINIDKTKLMASYWRELLWYYGARTMASSEIDAISHISALVFLNLSREEKKYTEQTICQASSFEASADKV
jgi:Reverse transcriptase (RNA-dependent DNA polymerase)